VFFLALLVASEAFLKKYLEFTPSLSPVYSFIFPICLALLIIAIAGLVFVLRKDKAESGIWNSVTFQQDEDKRIDWLFLAILFAGIFLRLFKLGSLADGMTYDEAYKGLDAIAIREFGERPIFLDWNGGREALVAYLVAFSQKIQGLSIVSERCITPITGCVTLLLFYLFVRHIFNRNAALLSTFLMAFSKYHIIHSRYGVRAGQFTVFEVGVLYFTARGLSSPKKFSWSLVIAGVLAGLGLYTYIAYRIFPLILLSFILQKDIRQKLRSHAPALAVSALLGLLIITPAVQYYHQNFESFTDRMQRTEVWSQKGKAHDQSPVMLIAQSAFDTMAMFTYEGDDIARHNVGIEPMLSPFVTAFFLFGLLLCVYNFRERYALFLLLYLFFALAPGILSVGAPNAPRVLGSIPPAIILTAIGILAGAQLVSRLSPQASRILVILIVAGAFFTGVNDAMFRYPAILDSLPRKVSALWGMDRDQTNVARLANQLGAKCEVYFTPQFFFHSTVEYLTYSKSKHRLYSTETDLSENHNPQAVALVILQPANMNLWWLRDYDGKKFYKWWNQVYGLETKFIRSLVHSNYDRFLTNTSDRRLLSRLQREYPHGKLVDLDRFSVFIVKP